MAVFRVQKTQNYTIMSNHHLRNKALSLKAKGLLSLFDLFHPYQLLLSSCHSSDFQIGKSKSPLASGGCLCYHKGKL